MCIHTHLDRLCYRCMFLCVSDCNRGYV